MSKRTNILLAQNNESEALLSADARQVLTDITVYIRAANISFYQQESARRDITQMLIDGENRGMSAKEVIGENYQDFCDSIIAELPELSSRTRLLTRIRDGLPGVLALLIIYLGFNIIEQFTERSSWPYFDVTVGDTASAAVIIPAAFIILSVLSKNTFNSTGGFTNLKLAVTLLTIILVCVCLNIFGSYPLFQIHALFVAAGIVVLFALYKLFDAKTD